ncbi:RE1 [Symbiodinium sp. CCMP2592]|nr:RE1 [Symbiodinium sp. CCMP2592]
MRDYQFWKEKLWARLMEQWAKGFTMTGQSCRTEFPRTHVEALADVDAGTVDRTWDVEVMYGAAGDQGRVVRWVARLTDFLRTTATGESEMSYKRSPRRMSDLREYLKEIGLCTLREYLKEIGLCTRKEYLKEIGLCTLREYLKEIGLCTLREHLKEIGRCTRKEYLMEIGLCTRKEYLMEIGLCTRKEYLMEIGRCTRKEYLMEIGLCTRKEYLKEIGRCTRKEYLMEIGRCTRKEYLMEIGLCTRKEYLKEIGRCTRKEYLMEIGLCTRKEYLKEIGRCTLKMYLMEIGRRTLKEYLMEIGRCTLSTYLKVIKLRMRWIHKSRCHRVVRVRRGMRQLQEVQLRQMDKKDGPELVKPGISSLPHLDPPGKDTSPVDIQDWLEEVGSIMGDLSDTSHEWWTGVRAVADEHYKKWVTATPMEKLTLALPRDSRLEQGKYGRVNARAEAEVKSEMVTKKVTGSSPSLVFKLLTTYRPGGEQEKTLLLEQLTTPEGVATPELAVQALRKWGRWFSRAKDLTVAVPDPVLMVKGLALIVAPVLVKNQDVWLRTTMMRNRLQLDSNPTEETTLDFHKHLQAEMELLSTATSTASRSAPRIKSAAATPDATTATTATPGAKARPDKKERLCKWFAKSDDGCRRGAECQFQHDWGTTAKTGRCLLCSALGHQKKDCPTKKQGEPAQQSPTSGPKGKGKGDKGGGAATSSSTAAASPATRSLATGGGQKEPPQPGPEPSPAGSPASSSKEPPGDLQQILTDAHQMLKTMMATTTPATTTTSGAPTYESIQRQLDEMKLKALKVSTPQTTEDESRGALLDSGATHVLRPARDEREHLTSKEVPVVLAGDEKRLLRQTPAGSIILDPAQGKEAQTILPLGGLVESLGCTLKWTRGGLMLKHPKYGTIRTRIRAGCPEIADPVKAAMSISELESRRMDELRQRTLELQDRLNAIRMMEAKTEDWRQDLAAYASEGCVVDGLQALYKSPIFKGLPEEVLMGMVPNVEANDKSGWEYLKGLPVSRRIRKKLMRSKAWVLNLYGGKNLKQDPVQSLNGQVNVDTNSEVVIINVEILLHGGWSMRGPAYKALMWGAMTSRVKAVIGSPPAKTYDPRPYVKEKNAKPWRTKEEPYGITGLSPTEMYYVNKETSLTARQILLYLVAHTCSKGRPVGWMMSNPGGETFGSDYYDNRGNRGGGSKRTFVYVVECSRSEGEKIVGDGIAIGWSGFNRCVAAARRVTKANSGARRTKQKSAYVLSVDVGGDMASLEYDFSDLGAEEGSDEPLDEEAQRALLESELADIELSEPEVSEDLDPKIQAMKAADKLWDDDELVAEDQAKTAADDEPLEGNHEIPIDHLYFIKPLKTKTGKEVMRAIQEVVLQLRQENLPVLRIHSDRAHELRSPALRAWTLDNNIWLTRTEGQAPQSNGTAERAVRFLKGRARTLLRSAGMGTEHWATAMEAAAHRQREERLRPEDPRVPCPYGTRVAIKKKRYGDGGRHDLLPHWTKGVYMGPVWDVNGGSAILEDETKRFTVTTHLRARLHDPGALKDEDEIDVLPLRPARRLLKKGPIGEDGLAIKKVEKENYAKERAALVKEILDLMEKDPVHKVKRPQLTVEDGDREDTSYSTVGAFNFGGKFGITKYTKEARPAAHGEGDPVAEDGLPNGGVHVGNNCEECGYANAQGVWEELQPGDVFRGKYHAMDVNGAEVPGQIHMLTEPVKVNPRRWHSPIQGTEGLRILVAGHTINSWRKLTAEMREELIECGFAVPDEEDFDAKLRAIQEEAEQTRHMEFEVHEGDCLGDLSERDSPVEVDEDITRCSKAAVGNIYTKGIEKILAELEGDLRVVHTVHPKEVEEAIAEWIPALNAEVSTLENIGAVKRLRGKAARDYMAQPGAVIVPGKAVFTVKPPTKEGTRFRRKARIVSCGNFQPKADNEINYSGGAVAEAVRLGIAEAARNRWSACTGDVVSAFLRAPVPDGTRLALRPPIALVKAGLAEADETQKMKQAKTESGLTFIQGQADADVWQIKGPDGETTIGLMIVYVDDFLILGPRWVTNEAYEWMAATWEVTPCQYAESSTSVRFLGMEIRQETNEEGEITSYTLDQEGYIEELLRQHAVSPTEKSLLPSAKEWMAMDPEAYPTMYTQEHLRAAQSITGELAWLAQRCRPDLSYTVSVMGSLTTKDPERVATIGRKTLAYLNDEAMEAEFLRWGQSGLGSPVAWKSSRQSLVTTSSAETELLEASEGATLTYSIDAMLSDVGIVPLSREVRVDNSAAITLASEEGGSWRTRHLKVRAAALRQRIQEGWARIAYCPGEWQLADGLTKILPSKRMEMLMRRWGLGRKEDLPRGEDAKECVRISETDPLPEPLAISSSWELYVLVTMLVICAVAIWEGCKGVIKGRSEAVRLKSLETSRDRQRLSKVELRTLSALLQRDPETLSREERVDLIHLAGLCGSDARGGGTMCSSSTSSTGSRKTYEKGTREAATQCELLGDVPKKVYMFQERDVCQKCVRGQREETEYRGTEWLR